MARKNLYDITQADKRRPAFDPAPVPPAPIAEAGASNDTPTSRPARQRQAYREGKRAVMFFLSEEAFSEMHVILARQGRRKVQSLMEELIDDWFRRENAPRLVK
jgi:hypothetical protein